QNIRYPHAKLVLYRGATQAGCGLAQSATGPFYCPEDKKVYLDLEFFDELKNRFGAPGEFAQAYVIAHEYGHHVQDVIGTMQKVDAVMERNPSQRNALSVRLELQADCYAGVWGHSAQQRGELQQGEAEEALKAASSVGDDRLQRAAGRQVAPDTFTHGSSAQRMHWFQQGFSSGDMSQCDTFAAGSE
ncbi:MAG: neutral zinc metallopeptidase, partial [Acidobacteriales bacterium]|nr:neutral zinc metallopeptidase [Terriglobales bacterium]